MLICLFTVLKQLPHWKFLFSVSSKKSSYKINKCLLLLPTIWLLVCIEVGKLKPREINSFNRSSYHWKWWNLWCPKGCRSAWVWESMGASARWCDSSETAVQAGAGGCAAPFPAPWQAGTASLPGQEHQQAQRCPPRAGRGAALPAASAQAGTGRQGAFLWCSPICGAQSQQVVLCWWFCLLSVYLSKSMTLKIPLYSFQILCWLGTLSPSLLLLLMESKIPLTPWM